MLDIKKLWKKKPKLELPEGVSFTPAASTVRLWFKYKKGTLTNSIPKGWQKLSLKKQESLWKTRT